MPSRTTRVKVAWSLLAPMFLRAGPMAPPESGWQARQLLLNTARAAERLGPWLSPASGKGSLTSGKVLLKEGVGVGMGYGPSLQAITADRSIIRAMTTGRRDLSPMKRAAFLFRLLG